MFNPNTAARAWATRPNSSPTKQAIALPLRRNSDSLSGASLPPSKQVKNKHKRRPHDERPDEASDGNVLAYLATLHNPASVRQIAHGMGLKHRGRRYLPRILQHLKRRGEVEEPREGCYRLTGKKTPRVPSDSGTAGERPTYTSEQRLERNPEHKAERREAAAIRPAAKAADSNLVSGRLVAHRDGYGFV